MMPVVRGEARTKYEMLVYTLMLLPLTLMPALFGALGLFYGVAAVAAGRAAALVLHPAAARAVGHAGGVADVPLLAALSRPAVRGDGHRPGAAVRPPRADKVIILGGPARPVRCRPPRTFTPESRGAGEHATHGRSLRSMPRSPADALLTAPPDAPLAPPAEARPPGPAVAPGPAVSRHAARRPRSPWS